MTEESTEGRLFTVEQANATLPLVSRIVQDIVTDYRRWQEQVQRYELAAAGAGTTESEEQTMLRQRVDELAQRINGYLAELEPIGCVFKGFDLGLVDFPARLNGRDIFLCWKHGESEVAHWHETDAGYENRQELVAAGVGENGGSDA